MTEIPPSLHYTEADLQRLPDLVDGKQVALVLGVKSSALRMMVRRGALDPPEKVGPNQAWYTRGAVILAWRRRQPDQIVRLPVTGPKRAEQTTESTDLARSNSSGPMAVMTELMRQLTETSQSQATTLRLVEDIGQCQTEIGKNIAGLADQHQTALNMIGELSAQVQGLAKDLVDERTRREAADRARLEAEHRAQLKAEQGRKAPSFWDRVLGRDKTFHGN